MRDSSFSPIPWEAGAGGHGLHTRQELTQDLPVFCLLPFSARGKSEALGWSPPPSLSGWGSGNP